MQNCCIASNIHLRKQENRLRKAQNRLDEKLGSRESGVLRPPEASRRRCKSQLVILIVDFFCSYLSTLKKKIYVE